MKLSEKLWCDLKTDSEKHSWLLMGMGVSTGVVCHAIQTDLANSYHVKMKIEKERDQLRELCGELLEQLKYIIDSSFGNLTREDSAASQLIIDRASEILGEKNGTAN